jgi:hypothetical protein
MRMLKYLNPLFVLRNRHLIRPYAESYWTDCRMWCHGAGRDLRVFAAEHGVGLTANDRRFASLKNAYGGQRAFIIGNGPSLRISDLERLSGEITLASNRIYVAYGETRWRPTFYSFSDPEYFLTVLDQVADFATECVFLPAVLSRRVGPSRRLVFFTHTHRWYSAGERPEFSLNALRTVYWGATITYMLMQFAWYLGIRDMYLVGVDMDYKVPAGQELGPGQYFVADGSWKGQFHPNYYAPGERIGFPELDLMQVAYEAARDAVEGAGGRIHNATRGGKLEVFPRVDFDQLVPPAQIP